MTEKQLREKFGDKLPPNYKHLPGTIIMIDSKGDLILKENKDGTVSGIPNAIFNFS